MNHSSIDFPPYLCCTEFWSHGIYIYCLINKNKRFGMPSLLLSFCKVAQYFARAEGLKRERSNPPHFHAPWTILMRTDCKQETGYCEERTEVWGEGGWWWWGRLGRVLGCDFSSMICTLWKCLDEIPHLPWLLPHVPSPSGKGGTIRGRWDGT